MTPARQAASAVQQAAFQARQDPAGSADPGFFDDEVLDQFQIPVGAWGDQTVDWIAVRLEWLIAIIEWPFDLLIGFLVEEVLESAPWVLVVAAFFVIGSLARNVKVGAFSAAALSLCAILGNNYWFQTARTIGFVGVAVLLCVIIGIPLGVACGRVDGVWRVVRPVLDGMQVVHSFVYMLPFIFFFGIGTVSATMVTMVFALPPLVRLTNLGIRQVPEDVVEASRAYGAPEWRVLADVQLPLARPAIMTGVNQTLLLAISMLGIAAIMAAGGLGLVLFQAITTQDVSKGMASGLAFFLVAVVLDRISQPEGADGAGLLKRVRLAWRHRRDPEELIVADFSGGVARSAADAEPPFAAVGARERRSALATAVGGAIAALSVSLTWSSDAGFISAYGRRADEDLAGESFNGLAASGGSWFGGLTLILGVMIAAAALSSLISPGRGPRLWTSDGAVVMSLALLVLTVVHSLAAPASAAAAQSRGSGVFVSVAGALIASLGAISWIRAAPHSPMRPLSAKPAWSRLALAVSAVAIVAVGAVSGWSFDQRSDVVITAETEARIEELRAKAAADPNQSGVVAAEISALTSQLATERLVVTDGVSREGPGLGALSLIAAVLALAVAVPAAGVFGRDERRRWVCSAVVAGLGAGVCGVASAWVATHVRSADPSYLTGVGALLTMIGGVMLAASAAGVIKEFRRSRVYATTPQALASSRPSAAA